MKIPEDDLYLGRFALEERLVARDALLECLYQVAQERRTSKPRPLGVVMVSGGLLTQAQLDRILMGRVSPSGQWQTLGGAEVGRLLVAAGLLTREKADECARHQDGLRAAGQPVPPLGELVVQRGYATSQQVSRALAYRGQSMFACATCGAQVALPPAPAGARYRCQKCGTGLLAVPGTPRPLGELTLRETGRAGDSQLEIDRGVAAFVRQRDLVRSDLLRDAQRLQAEFSEFGLVVPLVDILRRTGAVTPAQQLEINATDFGRIVQDPQWKQQAVPGYRILSRIAEGGFGTLWTAEAVFGGARVAVKLLHPERCKDLRSVARFEWEAVLLRRFQSPRIVRGLDHGRERGQHFMIMEYVEGRSLGQAVAEAGAFPVRAALQATRQVAEGIQYLHDQGFVHRDVRPDNAIIDGEGRVRLCDLGFAVALPPAERAGEAQAAIARDLNTLGILLYALLTGCDPYPEASSEAVATDSGEGSLPILNLLVTPAPPPVIQILKSLTHPDPDRRCRSAGEAAAALEKVALE